MIKDNDIVLNTYVRSRLGIGLPPRAPPLSSAKTLTDDTDRLTSEKRSLFNLERESRDEIYMEAVLKEVGEDLDQMIDCIEDYKRLISQVKKSEG